ncbi:hypothetical protein, partial [Kaarinaea lacus]
WYWAKLSGNKKDYQLATRIAKNGWQRFYTEQGWLLTENNWLKYANGEALVADGVLPSASTVLIDISLRLALHDGDQAWRHRIMQTLTPGAQAISEAPFWYASQILLLQQIQESRI